MQNNQAIPFNKENFKQIFSIKFLLVIAISAPSALVADYFSLPLAWFLGPMIATSLGALMGLKIKIPSYERAMLNPGDMIQGQCVITEDQTTIVVSNNFNTKVLSNDFLQMEYIENDQ